MRELKSKPRFAVAVIFLLLSLVSIGFVISDYRKSTVINGKYKYAMVFLSTSGNVSYVSFDPAEKQIFTLTYPTNLEIKSRSVGVYNINKLYTLGSYEGNPGEFTRKKVQGFMKTPVMGYLISDKPLKKALFTHIFSSAGTTLSRLDALTLYLRSNSYVFKNEGENELLRASAIEKKEDKFIYNPERFQQYLSVRVFDWGIGGDGVTAAVINQSGEDGMARDIGQFLTNAGVDVVSVRGAQELIDNTKIVVKDGDIGSMTLAKALSTWFGWKDYESGDTSNSRSRMIIYVGKDGLKLF